MAHHHTKNCTHWAAGLSTAVLAPVAPALANSDADMGWDIIRGVEIKEIVTETTYQVQKTFPKELGSGIQDFEITGYVTLTLSDKNVEEFILISDMGFCPYCGDPDHGATVQVKLDTPAPELEDGAHVTVIGALMPVFDPQTWQSTVLERAIIRQ